MTYDYTDHISKPDDMGDSLARLSELATEQLKLENELAAAKEEVDRADKARRHVSEVQIPELMEEIGIETFTTTSGIKIDVGEDIRASILVDTQHQAFAWLRENGHGGLIKRKVGLLFGMGEDDLAAETIKKLDGLDMEDKTSVHAGTLKKFIREQYEEGKGVPEDLFSVHRQRVAKVKIKK